jgi:hypothetical protein
MGLQDYVRFDFYPTNTIEGAITRQSFNMTPENFICNKCKHYGGGCLCAKNVFIAFKGGNMSGCQLFEQGQTCPHCGKNF